MARACGRRWIWAAAAALAALSFAGCLSTNPAGLRRPPPQSASAPAAVPTPPSALPSTPSSTPQPAERLRYFLYEVRKGDTLFSLSRRFGVTVAEIEADNKVTAPRELRIGRQLFIRRVAGVEAAPAPLAHSGTAAPQAPAGPRRAVPAAQLNRGKPGAHFWWPTAGSLARRYGQQLQGMADPGIAISAAAGTEVCAVADGTVVSVVRGGDNAQSVWGNVVSIEHAGGMTSWYGHLASVLVREGARVSKGQAIGTVGTTGAESSPMLAFRFYRDNRPVDPLGYLP